MSDDGFSKVISDTRVPVKIWTNNIEPAAEQQLRNIANLPFVYKHVAAMPDVHLSNGATVGSVIATDKAIIPAAVGVDIGCGVASVKLPLKAKQFKEKDSTLRELRVAIESKIPVGRNSNKKLENSALKKMSQIGE